MRRLLFLATTLLLLASCWDDQGLIVSPPHQLVSHQWYSMETDEDGSEYLCLWDFTAQKNAICFVWFDDLSSLKTFPHYTFRSEDALPYVCHKKGNTWVLTVDDGYDTSYYFSDITGSSAHVSTLDGYSNDLTICLIDVTPVNYD